jgi:adsorption protein B
MGATGIMTESLLYALLAVGIAISISSIDDLIVDWLWFLTARKNPHTRRVPPRQEDSKPRPRIAVFVANWHEAGVLGRMVEGNLANITYKPFMFVLGVYPNDVDTLRIAKDLAAEYPEVVRLVVNRQNGPTSKGQMLNEMFEAIYAEPQTAPELVVLHDSEDIIDPKSFDVFASYSAEYAFIQIPVFSLDSRQRSKVGATYMEEFAERHTREMVVRSALGSFVPSAGVGTCLRRDLIFHFLNSRGHVLQPGTVTEDYILGAETYRDGYRSTFVYTRQPQDPTIVATLEYFPKHFWAAVKQKSRWIYGIAFDATARLGWSGSLWDIFFFYRDRKGAITNLLAPLSLLLLIIALLVGVKHQSLSRTLDLISVAMLAFNAITMSLRLYFKAISFHQIYGFYGIGGILVRWPLAILINAIAVLRAWRVFLIESGLASRPIAWIKTQHELPPVFAPLTRHAPRPTASRAFMPARAAPLLWLGAVKLRSRRLVDGLRKTNEY